MTKLLITGISGFVGMNIANTAADHFEILGTYCQNLPLLKDSYHVSELNLTAREKVFQLIDANQPDLIVHAAGTRDVNLCERDYEYAFQSHVISTQNLVDALKGSTIRLIYISTDCVFPGIKDYYSEDDDPSPVNHYGRAKLIAEEYIKSQLSRYAVIRTSVMFGWTYENQRSNTVQDVVLSQRRNAHITLSNATYNTPLYVVDACQVITKLLEYPSVNGTMHLAGDTRLSRYDLGMSTAEIFGLDRQLIHPTEERLINRPINSCLQMRVLPDRMGLYPCNLMNGLVEMRRDEEI